MRVFHFLLSILLLAALPLAAPADTIVLGADHWCPINCEPKSDKPGYMVEIAKTVLEKAGHKVEYKVLPWTRAIEEARRGSINGIIGGYTTDAPDFVFPANELGLLGSDIYVLKTNPWVYNGLESLGEISLGTVKDYAYGGEMENYIKQNQANSKRIQMADGDNALQTNLRKLTAGRVDAIIESDAVFWYNAAQMNLTDKVKAAGIVVEPEKLYIGFAPESVNPKSKEYAKLLSDGMENLRQSGELQKILAKYSLQDWKK
jgi:polar amino acid transport system substrate-binding protein